MLFAICQGHNNNVKERVAISEITQSNRVEVQLHAIHTLYTLVPRDIKTKLKHLALIEKLKEQMKLAFEPPLSLK